VWATDFGTTACKFLFLFSADAAQEKVLLPAGVSKSAAHTVFLTAQPQF
jgi:hypothetical protein